jgi:K+-sensing histidine kinase KdpD
MHATPKMMLAISGRSPNAKQLIERAAQLAMQLNASWFVVHVRQPLTLHFRMEATKNLVPKADLDYARKLGARVIIESGDVIKALVSFARTMSVSYFITGRSYRPRISFTWQLPIAEQIQRKLPNSVVIIV